MHGIFSTTLEKEVLDLCNSWTVVVLKLGVRQIFFLSPRELETKLLSLLIIALSARQQSSDVGQTERAEPAQLSFKAPWRLDLHLPVSNSHCCDSESSPLLLPPKLFYT